MDGDPFASNMIPEQTAEMKLFEIADLN